MTTHPWEYLADACGPGFGGEKPTFIENLFEMPGYLDKLNWLVGVVPNALDDKGLCQAFNDLMLFHATIENFLEYDTVGEYSGDLSRQVADLVSKMTVQDEVMRRVVSDRGLMDVITHSDWPRCAWMPETY